MREIPRYQLAYILRLLDRAQALARDDALERAAVEAEPDHPEVAARIRRLKSPDADQG